MYSVLLAAMLTTGGEATAWGWGHGCSGGRSGGLFHGGGWCHGCNGGSCYGCSGCGGCYGCNGCSGCWGCYGGGRSHGCYGSCHGCWGCYGGRSSYSYSSCFGCSGCYGLFGCSGCYGSCYGSCYGCSGGVIMSPGTMSPGTMSPGTGPPASKDKKDFKAPPPGQKEISTSNVARISVSLPAEARLWVDDVSCPLTSSLRTFNTPALEPGRQYYYTLRVEINQGEQPITQERRIYLSAGQQINIDFNNLATASR
ncbi:MAG: TIGR03000 domain-containing protein [Planctomycetes bacterium]|nr:TIGR03000 domain-containing protein [Planctomycetota bacterium]